MGWRDLLQPADERIVLPWVGGRSLRTYERAFVIEGALPAEHGWHTFKLRSRKAQWNGEAEPESEILRDLTSGYLVGDRLVPEHVSVGDDLGLLARACEPVHMIEPGLDRFARVVAGRAWIGGPRIFQGLAFPLGPEDEVLGAFLDGAADVDHIPGVAPALDAAFRIERWRQEQAARRRAEAEAQRRREEEARALEERRQHLRDTLGDAGARRRLAVRDFDEAARAALAVGGAELGDTRPAHGKNEMVVRFRHLGRRFECICDKHTLRIIDAGVCLVDHHNNERGDDRFTLESLPAVIAQAEREGVLVVFRHVEDRAPARPERRNRRRRN
jgi:hypothetical protein